MTKKNSAPKSLQEMTLNDYIPLLNSIGFSRPYVWSTNGKGVSAKSATHTLNILVSPISRNVLVSANKNSGNTEADGFTEEYVTTMTQLRDTLNRFHE